MTAPEPVRRGMTTLFEAPDVQPGAVGWSVIDLPEIARDPDELRRGVGSWLDSDETARLLELFDRRTVGAGFRERLEALETIAAELFDRRNGRERWEADYGGYSEDVTRATRAVVARVYRAAPPSGAAGLGHPTHVLVPGARLTGCLLRTELLADLVAEGLPTHRVWGLGSRREATPPEREAAQQRDRGPVEDELDAMTVALTGAFDLPAHPAQWVDPAGRAPTEVRELAATPRRVVGLAAPVEAGAGRVTTAGTFRYFASVAGDRGEALTPDDHVLVVTSGVHAPFQHALALAELAIPHGVRVTSLGAHLTTSRYAGVRGAWSTGEWLQEILSTVRSLRVMDDRLRQAHPSLVDS